MVLNQEEFGNNINVCIESQGTEKGDGSNKILRRIASTAMALGAPRWCFSTTRFSKNALFNPLLTQF